jgi:hypothetical protein
MSDTRDAKLMYLPNLRVLFVDPLLPSSKKRSFFHVFDAFPNT